MYYCINKELAKWSKNLFWLCPMQALKKFLETHWDTCPHLIQLESSSRFPAPILNSLLSYWAERRCPVRSLQIPLWTAGDDHQIYIRRGLCGTSRIRADKSHSNDIWLSRGRLHNRRKEPLDHRNDLTIRFAVTSMLKPSGLSKIRITAPA